MLAQVAGPVAVDVSPAMATGVSVLDAPSLLVAADTVTIGQPTLPATRRPTNWAIGELYKFQLLD